MRSQTCGAAEVIERARAVSAYAAQRLHKMLVMKRIIGIVAIALLAGCGVGADDPEGAAAAGGTGRAAQAVMIDDPSPPTQPPPTVGAPPPLASPQDPIPYFGPVGGGGPDP